MYEIITSMISGIVSGIISGLIVYLVTKKREQLQFVYQYWTDFLFRAMEMNEICIPSEQLRYINAVGGKGTKWYKAINEILDVLNPFEMEDREFSEGEEKLGKNVLIALNELDRWAKQKKVRR